MNTNMYNSENDGLKQWFSQLPDTPLPPDFRTRMMKRIEMEAIRKTRRQTLCEWISVVLVSLSLIVLTVFCWKFWQFPTLHMPDIDLSSLGMSTFIGATALFLLLLDYRFRRWYYKRHGLKRSKKLE